MQSRIVSIQRFPDLTCFLRFVFSPFIHKLHNLQTMTDVLITRVACVSHGFDRQQGPSLCTSVQLIDAFSREILLSEDMQAARHNTDPNNKTDGANDVTSVIL